MELNRKGMLVKLSISQWSGEREDKTISREVCVQHNAVAGSGKFVKYLVPEHSMKPYKQSASRLYNLHKQMTLPWSEDGSRILKADAYTKYMDAMAIEQAVFETEYRKFFDVYDGLQLEAQTALGGLYNPADWPSRENLEKRFAVSIRNFPLPCATDFRNEIFAHIPPEDRDKIIAQAKSDEDALHQACIEDVFLRMRTVVGNLASKIREYKEGTGGKTRVHDSIVGNITNLVDLLPTLNVTDDPRIAELGCDMARDLACWSVETLKNSEHARLQAVAAADAFVDKMNAFAF